MTTKAGPTWDNLYDAIELLARDLHPETVAAIRRLVDAARASPAPPAQETGETEP